MIIMLSPIPFKSFTVSSGGVYVADQYGIIPTVNSLQDQADLTTAGCATLSPNPTNLLGKLIGANFNSTGDQLVTFNNTSLFRITRIAAVNPSTSLTTAAGGVYTAPGKSGTAIVAASQGYTALTGVTTGLDLSINAPNRVLAAGSPLYLSLTTPQGGAASADLYFYGDLYT